MYPVSLRIGFVVPRVHKAGLTRPDFPPTAITPQNHFRTASPTGPAANSLRYEKETQVLQSWKDTVSYFFLPPDTIFHHLKENG